MPPVTRRMAKQPALGPQTQPRGHASLPEAPGSMSRHQNTLEMDTSLLIVYVYKQSIRSDGGTPALRSLQVSLHISGYFKTKS